MQLLPFLRPCSSEGQTSSKLLWNPLHKQKDIICDFVVGCVLLTVYSLEMRVEELTEVCRLCLKNENLVCIFEQSVNTDSLKDVIFITTGVEVKTLC